MTTSHLITNRDLSLLCDIDTNCLTYSWRKLITVLGCEYLSIYNDTVLTVRNLQGSITYFSSLLTKDCTEQSLFCCKLSLSLWSNLTYQNITGTNLRTDTDDTIFIQILQCIVTDTCYITSDLFRSQLRITCFDLELFNMNRGIYIVHYHLFRQQNRILVVITFPLHESNQRVLTKSKFSVRSRRTISDNFALFYMIALEYDRTLVVAVGLVRTLELSQNVLIPVTIIRLDENVIRLCTLNNTCILSNNTDTRVNSCLWLHTGSNYRRLSCQKRYCLTLHVRSHQRTCRVIVLQEWNQGCSHREYHSWRHIHVIEHGLIVSLCLFSETTRYSICSEVSIII